MCCPNELGVIKFSYWNKCVPTIVAMHPIRLWWTKKVKPTPPSTPSPENVVSRTIHGVRCPAPLRRQLTLENFIMHRAIGYGSTSTIFEAHHRTSNTPCVIKICMKTRLRATDERRLRREINIHSTLSHPHILNFYACFEDEFAFYLVLEIATGGNLLDYIRREFNGYMHAADFRDIVLRPLLGALQYLQTQHVLHRDIKPENILVTEMGAVKLCDFGFSINSYEERPKSVVGTLEYMAPELLTGIPDATYDDKVDIWAIGVLTYECIAGVSPFYHPDERKIARAILDCKYNIPSNFSKELTDFLEKIFRVNPSERASLAQLFRHRFLSHAETAVSHRRSVSI